MDKADDQWPELNLAIFSGSFAEALQNMTKEQLIDIILKLLTRMSQIRELLCND